MSRLRRLAVNAGLVLLSLCLTLTFTELAVRRFAPQPTGLSHQDRYGLALHYPGITRYLPQFGHAVSFNSAGMRDREHSLAKPEGVYRVLLLGDSFMEALQVPFDSAFGARLEAELPEVLGRKVEVVIAGVSGWGTDDELRYLTEYGMQYHPDLVLVAMTLHNDVSDNLRRTWHTIDSAGLVSRRREPIPWLEYQELRAKAFLATRFQTYQLWRRVRHGGEIRQSGTALRSHVLQLLRVPEPGEIEDGWRLTAGLIAGMDSVVVRGGARLVLVFLPLRVQLSDSAFAAYAAASGASVDSLRLGQPQARVEAIADSLGIPSIDLLPGFRAWDSAGRGALFLDWDGHWNAAGHLLASELTVEGLRAVGFQP